MGSLRPPIHKAEQVLLEHYAWKIGSHSHLIASKHKWVNGKVPLHKDNVPQRVVATLIVGSLMLPHPRVWDVQRVHSLFTSKNAQEIRSLETLLPSTPLDTQYRPFTASSQYTTKTGYYILSRKKEICSMTLPLESKFFRILCVLNIMTNGKSSSRNSGMIV